MRSLIMLAGVVCLLCVPLVFAQDSLLVEGFETLDGWATGGQKEVSFDLSTEHVKEGEHSLHIHVEIDHENAEAVGEVKYPMGWPSVRKEYETGTDVSEYDFLEFDVYFESQRAVDPDFALNVTIRDSEESGIYRATLIDLRHGKWAHEKLCIRDIACGRRRRPTMSRPRFFPCAIPWQRPTSRLSGWRARLGRSGARTRLTCQGRQTR